MAAVSVTFTGRTVGGGNVPNVRTVEGVKEAYGSLALTGTYTSTKIPVTASDFGFDELYDVDPAPAFGEGVTGTGTFMFAHYDHANGYIRVGYTTTGTTVEAAADTNMAPFSIPVRVIGA